MFVHTAAALLASYISQSSAAPSTLKSRQSGPAAYCTSSDGSNQLSSITAPSSGNGSGGSGTSVTLSVDDTSSGYRQNITGFGAAVTDATVESFNTLSSSDLSTLLNDIVGSSGAGFSLMRHTIASSDLSGDPAYTYDDNNGQADPDLSSFALGQRGQEMAAMLAQMQQINSDLMILGSSWSPPGWMKLDETLIGTTNGNNLNDGYLYNNGSGYSSQFAQYFVKYIQEYNSAGVTIDAITIQNEPLNSNAGFPTMYVYDYESADLIQNWVGPALANASLDVAIWGYDHNTDVPSYPQTVISNAGQYVDTVAWHCYASALDWTTLSQFQQSNPGVTQYMTECYTYPNEPWNNLANFTIGPLQNWASGVDAWTLGANSSYGPHLSGQGPCTDCQGLVTVNNGQYTLNLDYYLMAQFSKYIVRGSTIVSSTSSPSYDQGTGAQFVASANPDGSRTVVCMNTLSSDLDLVVEFQSGSTWSGPIPSQSVVTWTIPSSSL